MYSLPVTTKALNLGQTEHKPAIKLYSLLQLSYKTHKDCTYKFAKLIICTCKSILITLLFKVIVKQVQKNTPSVGSRELKACL